MTIMRNPRGSGYVIRGEDGDIQVGEDGSERVYGSAREAQDEADRQAAWEAEEADRRAGGEGGQLAAETDVVEERRRSAADPDDQRERMDSGQARSGGYYDPYADDSAGGASDFDETSADIPIWGWLSGAQARRDAANAESEAQRMESGWDALSDYMPTPDDLAVDYEQSEYAEGPTRSELGNAQADANAIGQQRYAMDALRGIVDEGGLTQADRARMQLGEMEVGRSMRASREADLAAMQARGMGGSGAEMASVLGAQQAGADGLFSRDAEMQIEAQRRRDAAISALGGMAGDVRGQSFDEAATRGSATDDLNRWNTERRQGWYEDNTDRRNQSRESRSAARQQSYENRERQQAGKTNQWNSASAGRRADQARQDASNQAAAGVVGTLFEEIL